MGASVSMHIGSAAGLRRTVFVFVLACLTIGASWSGSAASSAAGKKASAGGNTPDVRSNAALVIDRRDGSVLFSRDADVVAPIASITKLMTALVVLDGRQPLSEVIEITAEDRSQGKGAHSRLAVGAKLTRGDLMHLALMSSENRAAIALGRNYPGGTSAFVRTMNLKAKALGMAHSRFVDASGLSSGNVSSPRDLARLVVAAGRDATIRKYSTSPRHEVRVGRTMMEFRNTNTLVNKPDWTISVQKTGYISEAGRCLVMQTLIGERPVVMVLLNSFGKYTRVADAKRIRTWMEARGSGDFAQVETLSRRP